MKAVLTVLSVVLMLGSYPKAFAGNTDIDELQSVDRDWSLIKNDKRHNITTYTKWEQGKKYRTFKFSVVYDATLDEVMRVALDYTSFPKWYFRCKESKFLKVNAPYEATYYSLFSGPIGQPDREIIARVEVMPISQKNKSVTLKIESIADAPTANKEAIRASLYQEVLFTPLEDGKVLSTSEGYFDPGGNPPAWASNYVQRNAAYETLLSMQRFIEMQKRVSTTKPIPFKYRD